MGIAPAAWDQHNELLDRVQFTDREIAYWEAQQQRALVALADEPVPLALTEQDQHRWLDHEVGAALHVHPNTAGDRIALAHQLVNSLPGLLKMVEAGELTMRHARAAADVLGELTADQIAQVEDEVLAEAAGMSVGEFTMRLNKAVHRLVPKLMENRRQAETDERAVWVKATRNGTVSLGVKGLTPTGAATVMNRLNSISDSLAAEDRAARDSERSAAAGRSEDDTPGESGVSGDTPACRTADQRRADALTALATHGTSDAAGISVRPSIGINVCVALSTLIGLDDQSAEITAPGFTPGTPISAAQARLLAFEPGSAWRRLVTDPTGRLVDYGRTTYRPPVALADFVTARDRTWRGPHCSRNAAACDLDHHRDWAPGGETNKENPTSY